MTTTKRTITVTRKRTNFVTIDLTLKWNARAMKPEQQERIFAALGNALRDIMTPEERVEFLDQLRAAADKAASRPPRRKSARKEAK